MRSRRLAVLGSALGLTLAMPGAAFANHTVGTSDGDGTGTQNNDVLLNDVGSPTVVGSGNNVNANANVNNNSQTVNVGVGAAGHGHFRGYGRRGVSYVRNVPLAYTGFDAWIVALLGAGSLAGGLALQRRAARRSE